MSRLLSALAKPWRILSPKGQYTTPAWIHQLFPWWLIFIPIGIAFYVIDPPREITPPKPARWVRQLLFLMLVIITAPLNWYIAAFLIFGMGISYYAAQRAK